MNIFELLGINNPETFVPIFVAVLVAEIILVILVFRLIRSMKRRKRERELRQKRLQRLKEIQAAKARKEAEAAKARKEAEAAKKQQEAEEKAQREAKERAVRERQEAKAKAAKEQEEAEKGAYNAETEAIAKVVAEAMAEKEAAEKAAKELQEAEAKSAKAQQEAEEKAAKAQQEAEEKAVKEKQEAEEKASKEQQEAEEKTVKDRQKEAEERISKAQKEAQEKIARARQEAEEAFKVQKKEEAAAQVAEKKEEQASVHEQTEIIADTEKPVISVQHVTMIFKVATSNVSGLKEYMIQKVEKKISHRELRALNDVSFDVYKGEVVGIIGTNGSGKSTILRIVSGALRPTSGQVVVDKRKVQLLTLGTGFDYELTAKENVYLNGSIIGYSREFIDQHYDEIVEFAELQDFMEEKVKNFSSGMVSRLGFAIATAGGAAEILILDEVLSVGDEFFRKKSLAKIQEMIHGGSTVLMVSHNMNTIRQNCSKVVWIEKGDLRMIGAPKEVCAAYSKLHS